MANGLEPAKNPTRPEEPGPRALSPDFDVSESRKGAGPSGTGQSFDSQQGVPTPSSTHSSSSPSSPSSSANRSGSGSSSSGNAGTGSSSSAMGGSASSSSNFGGTSGSSSPSHGGASSSSSSPSSSSSSSSSPGSSGSRTGSSSLGSSGSRDEDLDIAGDLRSTADAVREAAVKQASQLASDVGVELNRTVEAQKQRGVEAIKGFAKVVSNAADDLEDQSPVAARSVRDVAARIEDFSDTISHRDVDDLLSAATSFARARPMLFLGGAVIAGFALARFLKTSSDRRAYTSDYSATRARTSYDDNAAEI